MKQQTTPQDESLAKLGELIADIPVASLVTMDGEGVLRSRPMATLPLGAEPVLWFFTDDYSAKVDNVILHPQVCVSYAAPDKNRYVSVSGTAELVRDPDLIGKLWKPSLKAWFTGDMQDPDLALLRVDIVSAQYWDASTSKLVQLFAMLKALTTGEGTSAVLKDNEKLTVRERIGSDTAT